MTAPFGQVPPRRSGVSRALLWVVIPVVGVALVGLLIWGLVGGGGDGPTAAPTASQPVKSPTATGRTDPSGGPSDPDPAPEWGPVPPPNLDRLKDFSSPVFPQRVGAFTLGGEPTEGGASVIANYDDLEALRTVLATELDGTNDFAAGVERIADPTVVGDAVCGTEADDPETVLCLVAGSTATLEILAGADVTVQEAGEFATELLSLL